MLYLTVHAYCVPTVHECVPAFYGAINFRIVGGWMAGATVSETAQLTGVSTGTVTKVTSACRSVGKVSVNRV